MKQSYFAKYGRQLTCLLGLLGLAAPRAQAQTATSIYYTQGSSTAALDAVKSVAATGAGGATTLPAGATTLAQPTDIVVDRVGGYLYVADQYVGTGAIWRYNLNGTGQTRVVAATAGATYNGLALDAADGRLYFTQAGSTASQAALRVVSLGGALPATATTVATLPATFTRPGDLALDAAAGVLYVADQRTAGSIARVALGTGTVTTLVAGVANANYNGLALDAANGRLYFTQGSADATLDALKLVTLSTSAVTTLASGSTNFTQPTDLAFEPGPGQLYLTDQYVSTGPLLRYTVGVSNGTVSVSNRTALVSATTGAAYGGLALALTAPPVLATSTGAVTAPEQITTAIDPGLTVTDPDSPTLTSATVSISSGLVSAQDALSFTASTATTGNIAGSYNAGTGVLTLTSAGGTATLAQWQAALRSVAYRNSSDAPTTAARTISFVVNDGSQNSNVATRPLNVQAVNDAPVNTAPASISTPYNTDVAFTGANAITVSDVDAGTGTAFISTQLTATNGLLVQNGSSVGGASFLGPVSSINNSLSSLSFRPTPGFSGLATVTVLTNDQGNTGTGGALTATSTINITVGAPAALTATVSTTSASPTSAASIPFSVTFSQSVGTTFTASDVTVSNGGVISGSFSGSGAGPYTFNVVPFASGTVLVSLAAGVASDANATANTASNTVSVRYNQPVTTAPVLTSPANNSTISGTPTYAGTAPAGSTVSIYVAAGSGAAQLVGTTVATGGSFSLVSPTALASGTYSAYATAQSSGATTSANSNTNTFTVDATAPTVVFINRQRPMTTATNATLLTFRVTFSEPVMGVNAADFTLTTTAGTVSSNFPSVSVISGSVYDVTVSGVSGNGTVRLDLNASGTGITDAVGNAIGGGYTSGELYIIDQTAPTAAISTTATSPTSTSPIPFTVTFSKAVIGFMASSITVTNGTVSSALTTNGNAYSFSVTPAASGVVTVSVAANVAWDAVGNGNLAAAPLSVTYVQPIPAPTITSLNPATGPVGTQVTITGTNLSNASAVRFNGTPASSFVVNSATSLTAVVAAGTTTGRVTVTTSGGTATSPYDFVVRVAPTTVADAYTTPAGVTLTGNVLTNDLGTNPRAILLTRPANGTLALNPDGSFSYVPNASFVGTDSFTYYACDPNMPLLCGNPATVTITVVRVAPITVADSYTTPAGVTLTGNVLTNDIGTNPRAILITRPANGTLSLNPNGSFSYVPNPGFTGTDSFTYYACDSNMPLLCGNPATVTITVTGGGPITVADAYSTPMNTLLAGNVLTNDIGTSLRAILINRPTRGTLVLNPDGSFTYQPAAGYVGTDSFTYYACNMGSPLVCGSPATVTITIGAGPNTRSLAANQPSASSARGGATVTQSASALAQEVILTGSPNPFSEHLHLSFTLPTAQAYTLAIYDAQGRLVQQLARGQAEAGQAQQLDVFTHLYANGLYLVRLSTAAGTQLLKIIKQ
jgi:sugar lactone lactonase YvrE